MKDGVETYGLEGIVKKGTEVRKYKNDVEYVLSHQFNKYSVSDTAVSATEEKNDALVLKC